MCSRSTAVLLLALALGSCAPRGLRANAKGATAAVLDARAALRQGCYACLTQAIERLEPFRDRNAVARQLTFELLLLVALRERELGLVDAEPQPAPPAQLKLRAADSAKSGAANSRAPDAVSAAEGLVPALPVALNAATYLDLVRRVPWAREAHRLDFSVDPRRMRRMSADELTRALEFLHAGPADPVLNDYLAISLACPSTACESEITRIAAGPDLPPVLAYRIGISGLDQAARLETALTAEPRFDEVHFFLGRNALARSNISRMALRTARAELEQSRRAFARSATIAQTLAGVLRTFRDWDGALALYDAVLALVPNQEEALLGRVVALAQMRRYAESNAAATQLIDVGVWYQGEAHYWRGWGRLQLGELDDALADAEAAKRTLVSTDVYTLAGLVRLKRGELREARTDFDQAIERDGENCAARKYHGFVDTALAEPGPASQFFATAFDCFRKATETLRQRTQEADAAGETMRQRDVEESVREEADAALNAALAFARRGDARAALHYGETAQSYDTTRERAAQLLAELKARQR